MKFFRELGCTRVEIGVQSTYDRVLDKNNRGHHILETIRATKLLKDAGFKICYHMMPNLYGSTYKNDVEMFKELFSNPDFQPDMIKIYPCVVTKYAKLTKLYYQGKYIPYTDKQLTKLLIEIKKKLPEYVRVQRCIRDIPKQNIIGGSTISNLRQIIHQKMYKKYGRNLCKCIRCREIREDKKLPVKLKRIDYDASDGKEIFLQYVDKNNRIYALLRLRIPSWIIQRKSADRSALVSDRNAIIREVHTYGQMIPPYAKATGGKPVQHKGLGRKLIKQVEVIVKKEFDLSKIAVISGIGVRNYYRKLGYRLNKLYMIKYL